MALGSITVKSYGRYDINGFRFRSTKFEAVRPLAATVNTGVVVTTADAEGHESNYYGIIKDILEFTFVGNKRLKVVLFDCEWFDNKHGNTCQNEFGMVKVKHNRLLSGHDNFVLHTKFSRCIICHIHAQSWRLGG